MNKSPVDGLIDIFEKMGSKGKDLSWAVHDYAKRYLNPETHTEVNRHLTARGYPQLTERDFEQMTHDKLGD